MREVRSYSSKMISNETLDEVSSTEMPVFRMRPFQLTNRIACCSMGIPLNVVVVAVVVRSRQLWTPRNICWLALTLFNLLAIAQSVAEVLIFHLSTKADGSHEFICRIYSVFVGCPYALLLSALTIASMDRYFALVRREFYQRHATPNCLVAILVITTFLIAGGQTSPYWLGLALIKCGFHFEWLTITLCFQGVLSIVCLTVQVCLYVYVRNCIRYSRKQVARPHHQIPSTTNTDSSDIGRVALKSSGIRIPLSRRVGLLELRAARILAMGILPFCLVTIPLSIASAVTFTQCFDALWIKLVMVGLREFLLLHLIYIPSVLIVQSREFHAALRRFCRIRTRHSHNNDQFN